MNDAEKGMLDENSKLNTCVKRGGDADELSTFKCTFPVIVSVQEYLQTMVTTNQASIYLPFCDLTLFCH